jgi:hypothetical protein
MSIELGVYLLFWMEDLLQDFPQPPLTALLLNVLSRDTVLLNTTPTTAITREQISQIRAAIEHRAYGTVPSAECRQLVHHLLEAIQYRFQKYSTCRINGETYGHVTLCCYGRLEQLINRSTDDLSKIVVEDGPRTLVGDLFDWMYLRDSLAIMERELVIPYRCLLQNLFEAKDDVLALDLNEMNTIIRDTMSNCQSKLAELREAEAAKTGT